MNEEHTEAATMTLRQQVVSGVVLARLLIPRDFGLASMALLFVGVASVCSGWGCAAPGLRPGFGSPPRSSSAWPSTSRSSPGASPNSSGRSGRSSDVEDAEFP